MWCSTTNIEYYLLQQKSCTSPGTAMKLLHKRWMTKAGNEKYKVFEVSTDDAEVVNLITHTASN